MKQTLLHYERHFLSDAHPWLVFVHGAGGGIATWNYNRKAFGEEYNLLLLDLRDHGKSKDRQPSYQRYDFTIICEDIIQVLDHLKISSAWFLSLSMGSILLQKLLDMRPSLVSGMIMAGGIFKPNWKIHLFAHSGKLLSYLITYQQLYTLFSWIVLPRQNHAFSRRVYQMQSRKLTSEEFLKWLGLYRDFFSTLRHFFRRPLEVPCLVVMGSQDHLFLQPSLEYADQHERVEHRIIPHSGHICNIEKPLAFNQHALDFLRRHAARNPRTVPASESMSSK